MKSYFSIKPGATFFLGSSRTLVYHKDDVEIIYKTKTPSGKTYYAHVYLMLGGENSVTLYADWGDYFLHMSSIKDQEHFFGIMKRPCPTFVQIWQSEQSRQHIRHVCQCRSNHGLRNGYRECRLSQSRSNLPSFPSVGRDSFTQVPRCQQRFIFGTQFPLSSETLERPSGSSMGTRNIIELWLQKR